MSQSTCPSCNSEITLNEDDFGMVPCPSCGAMVFVDMEGGVQKYEDEEVADDISEPQEQSQDISEVQNFNSDHDFAETIDQDFASPAGDATEYLSETPESTTYEDFPEPAGELFEEAPQGDLDDQPLFTESVGETEEPPALEAETFESPVDESYETGMDLDSEPIVEVDSEFGFEGVEGADDVAAESAEETQEATEAEFDGEEEADPSLEEYDFDTPLGAEPTHAVAEYEEPEDPLAEIEAFGNDEVTLDGPLTYDLFVEGIDTAEMRTWIREALDDQRFLWNVEDIMDAITNGQLELHGLNPVKASLVVSRLKTLKMKITWRQSAIHE